MDNILAMFKRITYIEDFDTHTTKNFHFSKSLQYGKTQTAKFSFTPRKPGKRTLLVDVDTTQVKDFKAAADVDVLPS